MYAPFENLCIDLSARPETELLLSSGRTRGDTPTGACMKAQPGERRVTDEPQHRAESSPSSSLSSRPTSQDKYMRSSRNAQVEGAPGSSGGAITPPSITVNDGAVENDDPPPYTAIPPPYSAIAPPNHVGWPYGGPFSFGNSYSTDASPYTVEVPLAPFQSSRPPAAFHPEETNRQHMSLPMPLTPYRFFKFGYRGDLRGRWPADSRTAEKIEDRGSRSE